jgi:hypothetical protein
MELQRHEPMWMPDGGNGYADVAITVNQGK